MEEEKILWTEFIKGDKQAFEKLFLKFNPILYAVGLKITSDKSLVEDAIHETFIDLWNTHKNLTKVDTVKYYLIVCFRRVLVKQIKDQRKMVELKEDESIGIVNSTEYKLIEAQLNSETIDNLRLAIDNLPDRQKEIVELRYLKSKSYEEIEKIMSINYTSSRKLVYKAITNLRKHIKRGNIGLLLILAFQNLT